MKEPGYWIIEDVISPSECDRILEAIRNEDHGRSRAGIRHLMSNPVIRRITEDSRLLNLTRQITGSQLVPYKAMLFEKTAKANWLVAWHQDTVLPVEKFAQADGWGPVSNKEGITFAHAPTEVLSRVLALRVHLDASTRSNGPLRVIPGSHKKRFHDDTEIRNWVEKRPPIECIVGKGGVIAMSPLILHASSKCIIDEPRRVLHIEYAPSLDLSQSIRLAVS
jgi:ectoine hydroxylase-related dioxygenase (phytanoyl-CoA dioxygenase family)